MVFNSKNKRQLPTFRLNYDKVLVNVEKFKYLGIIFSSDLNNKYDILKCEQSFLKQFYAIFRIIMFVRKLGFIPLNILSIFL